MCVKRAPTLRLGKWQSKCVCWRNEATTNDERNASMLASGEVALYGLSLFTCIFAGLLISSPVFSSAVRRFQLLTDHAEIRFLPILLLTTMMMKSQNLRKKTFFKFLSFR